MRQTEIVAEVAELLIATLNRSSGVLSVMISEKADKAGDMLAPVTMLLTGCHGHGVHRRIWLDHMVGGWAVWSVYKLWATCPGPDRRHVCEVEIPEMREDAGVSERVAS